MHTSKINDFKDKGMYGYSPTNPSFYNLQMYSNPSSVGSTSSQHLNSNPQSQGSQNLYQNLQEVPYHRHIHNNVVSTQPPVDFRQSTIYSPPSPVSNSNNSSIIAAQISNSDRNANHRHIRKGSIVFTNPFTTTSSFSEAEVNHNHSNTNYAPADRSYSSPTSDSIHYQPIFASFGKESVFVTCPYCHHTDDTYVETVIGSTSLLWACIIPCLGFLLKSKRDVRHHCKNCLNVIGTHFP